MGYFRKPFFLVSIRLSSMTSLVIRAASVKDVSSIVEIRLAALTEEEIRGFSAPEFTTTYTSTEELRKMWSRENRLKDGFEVFVADNEGKIVGFIVFKMERDHGSIDNIVVAKEEQGKGIGRALVTYVEGIAKSNGCYLMKTGTTENADGVHGNRIVSGQEWDMKILESDCLLTMISRRFLLLRD
jgi:ribosomal protein S18 acetylase RimI-like enzyme